MKLLLRYIVSILLLIMQMREAVIVKFLNNNQRILVSGVSGVQGCVTFEGYVSDIVHFTLLYISNNCKI